MWDIPPATTQLSSHTYVFTVYAMVERLLHLDGKPPKRDEPRKLDEQAIGTRLRAEAAVSR
jgi:hypothetical protein